MPDGANTDGKGDPLPPSVTETMKVLKRLGYPDAQDVHKSSSLISKVNSAVVKRMGQLDQLKQAMQKPEMANSGLTQKTLRRFGSAVLSKKHVACK